MIPWYVWRKQRALRRCCKICIPNLNFWWFSSVWIVFSFFYDYCQVFTFRNVKVFRTIRWFLTIMVSESVKTKWFVSYFWRQIPGTLIWSILSSSFYILWFAASFLMQKSWASFSKDMEHIFFKFPQLTTNHRKRLKFDWFNSQSYKDNLQWITKLKRWKPTRAVAGIWWRRKSFKYFISPLL